MDGEKSLNNVASLVERDIRMLVEHHLEDHDELGSAARRAFEFMRPIPDAAEGETSLPLGIQLQGILTGIRTMAHTVEGESVLTTKMATGEPVR